MPTKTIEKVPVARSSSRPPTSFGNTNPPIIVKANALNPKPLSGNAVAVPRCWGQFEAHVLMAPANAEQLPAPVRRLERQRTPNGNDPGPFSYADHSGKYPQASATAPIMTPHRGPLLSITMPMGIPEAYMPMLPALPCIVSAWYCSESVSEDLTIMLLCVADRFMRSAYCGAQAEYAY